MKILFGILLMAACHSNTPAPVNTTEPTVDILIVTYEDGTKDTLTVTGQYFLSNMDLYVVHDADTVKVDSNVVKYDPIKP